MFDVIKVLLKRRDERRSVFFRKNGWIRRIFVTSNMTLSVSPEKVHYWIFDNGLSVWAKTQTHYLHDNKLRDLKG